MGLPLSKIKASLEDGLLSLPVTDLDKEGKFNPGGFAARLEWLVSHHTSSVFVASGTGEFFSLSESEYRQIVTVTAEAVKEKVPMVSSVGRSIPEAVVFARISEQAGMNALLLMPPYLTGCPQDGVYRYAKAIMDNTGLPVIYYNRANGVLSSGYIQKLAENCENFIGLKDGTGNIQELNDTIKSVGKRLSYIGGVPAAEIISEAYLSIGVNTYSSAVFNFVPDLANLFYSSLIAGNKETAAKIIRHFFIPFVRLRNKKKGYAVSLIKAGAQIIGRSAGDVRAPLVMPSAEDTRILEEIIRHSEPLLD